MPLQKQLSQEQVQYIKTTRNTNKMKQQYQRLSKNLDNLTKEYQELRKKNQEMQTKIKRKASVQKSQTQVSQGHVQYIKSTRNTTHNKQQPQQDEEIQITQTTYSPVNKLQQASRIIIPVPPDNHCALHTLYLILYTFKNLKTKPREFIKTIREKLCEIYDNSKYTDPNEWLSITDLNKIAEDFYKIQLQDVDHLNTIKEGKGNRKEWYYYEFKNKNHFNLVIPLEKWDKLTKTKKKFLENYVTNKANHIKLTKKDLSCKKIKKK